LSLRRRALSGRPLLVGCAGAIVLVSCGGATSGNLVAPPQVELCVTVEPPTAAVMVDEREVPESGCLSIYEGTHELTAEAEGYEPYAESIEVSDDTTHDIVMTPE
jgi:hypothetical protein